MYNDITIVSIEICYISLLNVVRLSYRGFISLGANFPEWSVLSFSRSFPDLEIHDPNNRKTHVIETSHKVYACT